MFEFDGPSHTPVSEGETYDVTIEDVGQKGDGLAKIDGFVIFVPGTDVGDEVTVRVNRVSSTAAFAEKVNE